MIISKNDLRLLLILLTMAQLTACGDSTYQDLEQQIHKIKTQKQEPIPPLPKFSSVPSYTYAADNMRSPFAALSPRRGDLPDQKRPKEPLEGFPLDGLKMVGTLQEGSKRWAIIAAPNGMVYNVTVGNYIGQNYGRIVKVDADRIDLIETVQGAEGWLERPTALTLVEQE